MNSEDKINLMAEVCACDMQRYAIFRPQSSIEDRLSYANQLHGRVAEMTAKMLDIETFLEMKINGLDELEDEDEWFDELRRISAICELLGFKCDYIADGSYFADCNTRPVSLRHKRSLGRPTDAIKKLESCPV